MCTGTPWYAGTPWLCLSWCLQPCSADELIWRLGSRLLHSLLILPVLGKCKHWAVTAAGGEERWKATGERDTGQEWGGRDCWVKDPLPPEPESDMVLLQHTAQTGLQCCLHPHWSSTTGNGICTPPALLHGFTWFFQTQPWYYKQRHSEKQFLSFSFLTQ